MNNVIVCPEPLAADAGAEIFRRGGSAIDATLAAAYVQTVVDPAMASIGGTGSMQIYHSSSGQHLMLDFMGYAGSRADPEKLAKVPKGDMLVGYQSILVPTFVLGTHTAFARFGSGRVSWSEILDPAIRYAEDGFAVYPYMHQYWRAENPIQQTLQPFDGFRMLTMTDACAKIFTIENRVHAIGERIIQRDLGRTLRLIAEGGAEEFYTGVISAHMSDDFDQNDAPVTAEDLEKCRVHWRAPLHGTYQGLRVVTDGPPNVGPLLIELLNILERRDLVAVGPRSADYLRYLARAHYLVFQDRARFMSDPDFGTVPTKELISKEHADKLGRLIEQNVAYPSSTGFHDYGTTQVCAYDEEGSAISFTHSIGIGSGVVTPGLGFIHNNSMDFFDRQPGQPNSVTAGKRPVSGGGPTMVFQNDKLRMVLGSPHGSRKVSAMAHVLVNILDFGLDSATAIASPRIHCEFQADELRVDTFFPPDLQAQLESMDYIVRKDPYGGRVCLIEVSPDSGIARGTSDPRGGGGLAEL